MANFCRACGKPITGKFCSHCGAAVQQMPQISVNQQPNYNQPQQFYSNYSNLQQDVTCKPENSLPYRKSKATSAVKTVTRKGMPLKMKTLMIVIAAVVIILSLVIMLQATSIFSGRSNPFDSIAVGDVVQLGGLDWIVINLQDDRALVLSKFVLPGNPNSLNIGLRSGSSQFYDSTFSRRDNRWIIDNRVFSLGIDDVLTFMDANAPVEISSSRIATYLNSGETSMWWLRPNDINPYGNTADNIMRGNAVDKNGEIVRWLHSNWQIAESNRPIGIRPAMWITLE